MSPVVRNILGVILAILVAGLLVAGIETMAARIHPIPGQVDLSDGDAVARALAQGQIPFANLALVLSAWLVGAYAGGLTAWRFTERAGPVWTFALLFTVAVYSNLAAMPHPVWMWWGGLLGAPLFALGGGKRTLSLPAPR